MSYMMAGPMAPEVPACSYGRSRLVFRGPARALAGVYAAALGGAGTFGKGVARPWPALLEAGTGLPVVNFGAVGAGPDAFLQDDTVLEACARAAVTVLHLPGAQGLNNPFYRVHPRRNDRFLQATPALQALYPEVDFCEFAFVRHLLGALHRRDPARFGRLVTGLQAAWSERMAALLARLDGPVVLLWLGAEAPPPAARLSQAVGPLLVTRPMLEALRPQAAALVEVVVRPGDPAGLPGAAAQEAAAAALAPALAPFLADLPQPEARRAAG